MTYWLILFETPKPINNTGPLKYKITRARYDTICELESPVIDCDKGMFEIHSKKIFSIEEDNSAFIVCEAKKIQKQ